MSEEERAGSTEYVDPGDVGSRSHTRGSHYFQVCKWFHPYALFHSALLNTPFWHHGHCLHVFMTGSGVR
jgi:hypothetical protein